ncbi:aminoglycoside phosphotransferase family protein [Micromonospora sp. WMMD1155]|uniref:phosphotransferase family protein n=1 Tax=Micromonospora sp. WMMD1155 TaxID=3016094 RepID=UPI00249A0A5A|nr:aminoglycoside phosphotransferase family protein [Micromonospora sp. WMMD1155]WFE55037.1 aminoglycoside phosphotransferase family protein [Micromonospora sp. WMMD1155]
MTAAMREIAATLGVSAEGAQLLQMTNNAVFALPDAGLVIRIARTHQLLDRVTKVVRLGNWFAEVNAPTTRLAPYIEQPIQVRGLAASLWRYIPRNLPASKAEDLGMALREFHTLGTPPFPLPLWDPIGDARRRLADADGLNKSDYDFLVDWCNRLEPEIASLSEREMRTLIHGDAHVGNLLREPSGRAVMCDFDATCVGPWQVDLAAVAVSERRFGTTGAQRALALSYDFDVTYDPNWGTLREARELKMIVAAVPIIATSEDVANEFNRRILSIREKDLKAAWKPFSALRPPHRN